MTKDIRCPTSLPAVGIESSKQQSFSQGHLCLNVTFVYIVGLMPVFGMLLAKKARRSQFDVQRITSSIAMDQPESS